MMFETVEIVVSNFWIKATKDIAKLRPIFPATCESYSVQSSRLLRCLKCMQSLPYLFHQPVDPNHTLRGVSCDQLLPAEGIDVG
jgi:hypothetical protein